MNKKHPDFWFTFGKVAGFLTCSDILKMLKDFGVTDDELARVQEALKPLIKAAYKDYFNGKPTLSNENEQS